MQLTPRDIQSVIGLWLTTLITALTFYSIGARLGFEWLGLAAAVIVSLLLSFILHRWHSRHDRTRLEALHNGLHNLLDNDFSVSLAQSDRDQIDDILGVYNTVTEKLRKERQTIYQRELLLDTVIQNTSLSLILTDHNGTIVYSNAVARHIVNAGKAITGLKLGPLLDVIPPIVGELIRSGQDGLFTLEDNGVQETYHLSHGRFVLNSLEHRLLLIKKLTRELQRQELNTWKKVIRVISHELNNSLAPISSMAHSGKVAIEKQRYEYLREILDTISERSEHLSRFVSSYANVVKLPKPDRQLVPWSELFESLKRISHFELDETALPSTPGYFDATQIQQVLVNLLKNAKESGSPDSDVRIKVWHSEEHSHISVSDRGSGMNSEVMSQALVPFYTTKKEGSGIGLPLCREIIDLHDGSFRLENREEGGLRVLISLPLMNRISASQWERAGAPHRHL
jgi:nitrogen fixation/metabolism regulation signal transduction histidine kinase